MTRSARAIRAAHSTQKASREILVSLLRFSAGVRITRNDPQSPRDQGEALDVNGVKPNHLKFGHSAVRPSAADPFCGSWWEKSWGSRGPEAALASPKKSPHRTAGDPLCCSLWEKSWGSRGPGFTKEVSSLNSSSRKKPRTPGDLRCRSDVRSIRRNSCR